MVELFGRFVSHEAASVVNLVRDPIGSENIATKIAQNMTAVKRRDGGTVFMKRDVAHFDPRGQY